MELNALPDGSTPMRFQSSLPIRPKLMARENTLKILCTAKRSSLSPCSAIRCGHWNISGIDLTARIEIRSSRITRDKATMPLLKMQADADMRLDRDMARWL